MKACMLRWFVVHSLFWTLLCGHFYPGVTQPLPYCRGHVPNNFLASPLALQQCGLPSSRSYLYSQYNTILELSPIDEKIIVGKQYFGNIRACRPSKHTNLWRDNVNSLQHGEWTIKSCIDAEINLWGRFSSYSLIKVLNIRRSETKDDLSCEWNFDFVVTKPGRYSLEILNVWLFGSTDPENHSSNMSGSAIWSGVELLSLPSYVDRGAAHASCQDRCSLYDSCGYFTQAGQGKHCCFLFKKTSIPAVLLTNVSKFTLNPVCTDRPVSGLRKIEPYAPFFASGDESCRKNSHVMNSPYIFYAIDEISRGYKTDHEHEQLCSTIEVSGQWERFDESVCSRTLDIELERLARNSMVLNTTITHGKKVIRQVFHNQTGSIIYIEEKANAPIQYRWNPPIDWTGARHDKPRTTPPWQLHPKCSLGSLTIPPGSYYSDEKPIVRLSYYSGNAPKTGYEWVADSGCRYRHYNRREIAECFIKHKISDFMTAGDSVLGGVTSVLKWIIGYDRASNDLWYIPGQKHTISSDTMNLQGDARLSMRGFPCKLNDMVTCLRQLQQIKDQNSTTVVIVNFHLQHLIWGHTKKIISSLTVSFFSQFDELKTKNIISTRTKFMFLNMMALHGLREPYCTMPRARWFSEMVGNRAARSGWLIVDGYNITLGRPDLSSDGMHFNDAMNYMISQMMLNSICLSEQQN